MTDHDIPSDVRRLLHDHVETYEQLELLNLMASGRQESWAAGEAAAALGTDVSVSADACAHLTRAGVLAEMAAAPGRYIASAAAGAVLPKLAAACRRDRLAVMNLMTANALERARTSAMRAFAAAFMLGNKRG